MLVTEGSFPDFLRLLLSAPYFTFDIESNGLLPFQGHHIIGMSFKIPDGNSYYLPFRHKKGTNLPAKLIAQIGKAFRNPAKMVITWNGKFDFNFMLLEGIDPPSCHWDAMLGYHLINENEFSYALKPLSKRIFGAEAVKDDEELTALLKELGLGKDQMDELTPEQIASYAESDVILAELMFRATAPVIKKENLQSLANELMDYNAVITRVEQRGVPINKVSCTNEILRAEQRIEELRSDMVDMLALRWDKRDKKGRLVEFNPMSAFHAREIFNIPSSAKEILEELEDPLAKIVVEYRAMGKAIGSFYKPFLIRCDECGRMHPTLNLHGTVTGRLSCTDPNAQALPRNSNQFHHARSMVEARAGRILLSADYSQAELRLLAHYTQDKFMMKAYLEGIDIHQMIAEMLGRPREQTKSMNFMMVYGGGVGKAMKVFQCGEEEATKILNRHRNILPGVRQLYYEMERKARTNGYISMWTGRRRRFVGRGDYHKGMSNLIQGGVGEIMRVAMTRLDAALPSHAFQILQVHDEVLLECDEDKYMEASEIMRYCMEDFEFRVPMLTDQKVGKSWGSMTPIPR